MNKPQRTQEGKWAIYHRETGQRIDRWPVDAQGMLDTGEYVADAPDGASTPKPLTPEERGIVEKPDAAFPQDKHGDRSVTVGTHHGLAEQVQDRSVLPVGYSMSKRGRFVALTGPDGEPVKSTTPSGKYDGTDAAIAAAWSDA